MQKGEKTKAPDFAEPNSSLDIIQDNKLKQRRYYGDDGRPIVDIDYSHSGIHYTFPHKHIWRNDLEGRRSKHQ